MRCQLIWAKNTFAWGFGRYKFQHEPIFYVHAKPVELVERALLNSSKAGAVVADLFGGSGSTLMGCERRGRKARLMEIDPQYCDATVRRWQMYTGKAAVLDGYGRKFEDIERERTRIAA